MIQRQVYDRKRFLDGGFKHHEMYFPDGSCPTDAIIQVRPPRPRLRPFSI